MTNRDALFRAVLDAPTDPLPKRVLADWLDEHDQPWVAHAFRWAAKHGKHPRVSPQGRYVAWGRMSANVRKPELYPFRLPGDLYDLLRPRGRRPFKVRDPYHAFLALADTFQAIREMTDG